MKKTLATIFLLFAFIGYAFGQGGVGPGGGVFVPPGTGPAGPAGPTGPAGAAGAAGGLSSTPSGYTGPTIRMSANSSIAPVIIQPSSGSGTATLTFNPASQGNCQANDEMFFFLQNDSGAIVNASGTHLDSTSYTNGRSETWHQTWAASTSVIFTDTGNHIWSGWGICVTPGTRGHPVLVDTHQLISAAQATAYEFSYNSWSVTPGQNNALYFIIGAQVCAASCAVNNTIFLDSPEQDFVAATNGEGWIFGNLFQIGGVSFFVTYRKNQDRGPNIIFPYIGATVANTNSEIGIIGAY